MIETKIESIIDDAVANNIFGFNFKFRSFQKEAIIKIVKLGIEKPNHTVIIDAPTGAGKSIISIVSSYVLTKLKKRGYILTSDLMLQNQYNKDIELLNLNWGSIKGIDNYKCDINDEPFSTGHCRNCSIKESEAINFDCYKTCGYYQARYTAKLSEVTLMNYSYWLLFLNYASIRARNIFSERDFTFFDECHKIDSLVQSHFGIMINKNVAYYAKDIKDFLKKEGIKFNISSTDLKTKILSLLGTRSKKDIMEQLISLESCLSPYRDLKEIVSEDFKKKFGLDPKTRKKPTKEWIENQRKIDRLCDIHCKVEDYVINLRTIGYNTIVKIPTKNGIEIKTTAESFLIKKTVLNKSKFKVFLSATIGDIKNFIEIMGIDKDDYTYIPIQSTFNFNNSDIYHVDSLSLAYKEKNTNLPKVLKNIENLLNLHKTQRGIIHTASYEFTNALTDSIKSDRFITYTNASEKEEALKKLRDSKNGIIIGPSIYEGLDLPDDLCRFQILMKVPYPSLADPLVKAKLEVNNTWYTWKTLNNVLQSLGRGIRHKDDYAVTYLMDDNFKRVLVNYYVPTYIKKRIKTLNSK